VYGTIDCKAVGVKNQIFGPTGNENRWENDGQTELKAEPNNERYALEKRHSHYMYIGS